MLPSGDPMARAKVVCRKCNAKGNPIGPANNNTIPNTRQYEVQFADGEVTELTTNAIAKAMYAECDEDGKVNALFDSFVDFRKTGLHCQLLTRRLLPRVDHPCVEPLLVGSFVASGTMAQHHRKSSVRPKTLPHSLEKSKCKKL